MTEESNNRFFLVPVDNSAHSERAFDWYLKNIYKPGDKLGIVHIHESPRMSDVFGVWDKVISEKNDIWKEQYQSSIKDSQDIVDKFQKKAKDSGVNSEVFLTTNEYGPGHAICDLAEKKKVDGIVMGSRGLNLLRRTFLGSVSSYVMHHSNTPVTVTPTPRQSNIGVWSNTNEKNFIDSLNGL